MSYKKLEVWVIAREAVIKVHRMTLTALPKFEMFEVGSQIRRSVKSVKSNIVEGYGRRRYKAEYLKFLIYAKASCDETADHLDTLFDTGSLTDDALFSEIAQLLDTLGRKLYHFIESVEEYHNLVREESAQYETNTLIDEAVDDTF